MLTAGIVALFLGFFLGLGGFWVYTIPITEKIIVDSPKQLIIVDRNYLIRGWQPRHIGFDEIAHITYDYTPASDVGAETPSSGKVVITMINRTKFQVSEDGPTQQRELAETIARATQKPLRRE